MAGFIWLQDYGCCCIAAASVLGATGIDAVHVLRRAMGCFCRAGMMAGMLLQLTPKQENRG